MLKKRMHEIQPTAHFTLFFGVSGLLFSLALFVNPALAADTPAVDILSPTANPTSPPVLINGTDILFEAQLTAGSLADSFKLEWEFDWNGTTVAFPDNGATACSSYLTQTIGPFTGATLPVRYNQGTGNSIQLRQHWRYPVDNTNPNCTPTGTKNFRVRLTDQTTLVQSVVAIGKVVVVDNLFFSGYTWLGSSTTDHSGDPLGWISFSCVNENISCNVSPTYKIQLNKEPNLCVGGTSAGRICSTPTDCPGGTCTQTGALTLRDEAWLGEQSPASVCAAGTLNAGRVCTLDSDCGTGSPPGSCKPGAGSLGWFTYNKGICKGGSNNGFICATNTDCSGGTCSLTGTPPATGEAENWSNLQSINRVYTDALLTSGRYPGQLTGWGRFLTLSDYASKASNINPPEFDWGWLHLRGPEAPKNICNAGTQVGQPCVTTSACIAGGGACTVASNGYTNLPKDRKCISGPNVGQVCTKDSDCGIGAPVGSCPANGYQQCIDCAANGTKCNTCAAVQTANGVPAVNYSCSSCYDCATDGSSVNCKTCELCNRYGVAYDTQRETLVGYAYSGANGGLGWVQFDPPYGGLGVLQKWLATRYGDIYTSGKITSTTPLPAPPGAANATYVIQANGTIAFKSQQTAPEYTKSGYPQIPLPQTSNQYINVLGRLNFIEMTKDVQNRFTSHSQVITKLSDVPNSTGSSTLSVPLNGGIYHVKGNLTIPAIGETYTSVVINNGQATQPNGSGTIIVDGNVTIKTNITYDTATIDLTTGTLQYIPSLAMLVRGNITIDPAVGRLDGVYMALGCFGETFIPACPNSNQSLDGLLATGNSGSLALVVNGLMMARKFNFERQTPSVNGSEQVIFNGNTFSNPPPGLADLTVALPQIREVTP